MIDLNNVDDNNVQAEIQKLKRRMSIVEQRNVSVNALDELGTDDMGDMRAGRFLALLSGSNPTDADASGSFMSAAGETFGAWLIRVGEVLNGKLQAGFGGGALVWAGGDGVGDANGLNLYGIRYGMRHYATDAGGANARYGRYEMLFENGKTIPELAITYMDGANNPEKVLNPGFETGDFTSWTTHGSPTIFTPGYQSNYCFYSNSNTNWVTQNIDVTAGLNYVLSFFYNAVNHQYGHVLIRWYTAGSVLIKTDFVNSTKSNVWFFCSNTFQAPLLAVTAQIVIFTTGGSGYYCDSVSLKLISITRQILFGPELEINDNITVRKIVGAVKELPLPLAQTISLVATASGNCDNGAHTCKVTFVDSEGETLPSAISNSVTVDASHKQITCPLPIGPWGTTGRNVYMCTVADATIWYLAATISDNTTTTTNLSISDASLSAAAVAPGYNTTGSRPMFPRSATVFVSEFTYYDASGNVITGLSGIQMSKVQANQKYNMETSNYTSAVGDTFSANFYLEDGNYTFIVYGTKAATFGIYDVYLDGVKVITGIDQYASSSTYDVTWVNTNITVVGSGYHKVDLVITGKSGSSYRFGLTYIAFEKSLY